MEYIQAERAAITDLGRSLHFELTGEILPSYQRPHGEVAWQLMQALNEAERAATDLLNDYRSTPG